MNSGRSRPLFRIRWGFGRRRHRATGAAIVVGAAAASASSEFAMTYFSPCPEMGHF